MRWILENFLSFQEAAGTVYFFHRGERTTDYLLGCGDDPLESLLFCSSAARISHTNAVCQNPLNRATVKGHQQVLCELVISEYSQKMQSLLCLFNDNSGVDTPGQIFLHVNAQKTDVRDPLHTVTSHQKRLNVCFLPFEVYYQLIGLGGVQDQVVFCTPHRQLLHLIPVGRLFPPRDEPHHGGIISKLNYSVTGMDNHVCRGCTVRGSAHSPEENRC